MPVLKNDIVTVKDAAPATRTTPTFNVPADVFEAKMSLTRDNWPEAPGGDLIEMLIEYSPNAGQSWGVRHGFTVVGGVLTDEEQGTGLVNESAIYFGVPDVGSNQRRLRAVVTNTEVFSTTCSITTQS